VLTSSDDDYFESIVHLELLAGKKVLAVDSSPPSWDLKLRFENDLILDVFCDYIGMSSSSSINWEFSIGKVDIEIVRGCNVVMSARECQHFCSEMPD
jgi:hypothetical protein